MMKPTNKEEEEKKKQQQKPKKKSLLDKIDDNVDIGGFFDGICLAEVIKLLHVKTIKIK